jgi:dTDP-4-dehydrorhamnose reductase
MAEKRFLILGARGQLGSEWVARLQENGFAFKATDYPELDITNEALIKKYIRDFQPDVVVNCAAYTNVDKAEDEPEKSDLLNYHAVEKLASICNEQGILLIHYSTDYVFSGKAEDEIEYPVGYPEDAPVSPINAYGLSKWKGEDAVRRQTDNHLILRVSWLCGSVGHNFIKTMIRLGKEKDELRVVNDQIGSPTFTADVVDGCLRLLEKETTGTYHITSAGKMSWYNFAADTLRMAGIQTKVVPISSSEFPMKAKRPYYSKLNTAKFEAAAGGVTYNYEAGLEKIINDLSK